MSKVILVTCGLAMALMTGCAMRSPLPGVLYTDVTDAVNATYSQAPTKRGDACEVSYLGLVAMGEASINAAREAGHIRSVSSVDNSSWSILGIYSKYCVIVRGN